MTETLEIIYFVCGIAAMLAATVAMTIISIRSAEEIKHIRKESKRDAELFEYKKQVLDRVVGKKGVVKEASDGEEQQGKEE